MLCVRVRELGGMGEVRKLGEKLGVDKSCAACSSCDFRCADEAGRLDRLSKPCGGFSPMSESSGLFSFLRVEIYISGLY